MYKNAYNKIYRVLNNTKWKICIHEKRFQVHDDTENINNKYKYQW